MSGESGDSLPTAVPRLWTSSSFSTQQGPPVQPHSPFYTLRFLPLPAGTAPEHTLTHCSGRFGGPAHDLLNVERQVGVHQGCTTVDINKLAGYPAGFIGAEQRHCVPD